MTPGREAVSGGRPSSWAADPDAVMFGLDWQCGRMREKVCGRGWQTSQSGPGHKNCGSSQLVHTSCGSTTCPYKLRQYTTCPYKLRQCTTCPYKLRQYTTCPYKMRHYTTCPYKLWQYNLSIQAAAVHNLSIQAAAVHNLSIQAAAVHNLSTLSWCNAQHVQTVKTTDRSLVAERLSLERCQTKLEKI